MRLRKITIWASGVFLALLLIGAGCTKWYLGSSSVRQTASSQLSEMLGMSVDVDSLDIGLTSSTASLSIPDPTAEAPFLRIGRVETDLNLPDLLSGKAAPKGITAIDAELVLRLDANGKILSPLPTPKTPTGKKAEPLPAITVRNARIRIRQVGRPEFDLTSVNGKFEMVGEQYEFTGEFDDPHWGKWTTEGHLDAVFASGVVKLNADEAVLNDPQLRSIPFLPPEIWEHVGATGTTAAKIEFTFVKDSPLGYTVDLIPKAAFISVPDIGVAAAPITGAIRIADDTLTVSDGRVSLAGGAISGGAVYKFNRPDSTVAMNLVAKDMDIRKLPQTWGLPKELEGRLRGKAELEMTLMPDGTIETRGGGKGDVEAARFAGFAAEIKLNLAGRKGRYQFETQSPE